jgi:hypothetical protein
MGRCRTGAQVFMTSGGIVAGFDGGSAYNLTLDAMVFPGGSALPHCSDRTVVLIITSLRSTARGVRQLTARIGDYCEAEIVRRI